ncbi:MAG: DUF3048 domain-containing protein, partial [Anaerolineales bacterium]|nr:DUF3048 domain-containing protein [Anaerolineales bacterium]
MNKIRFIPHPSSLLILFLVLILAACGGKMPTPTATSVRPANTAVPVAQATDSPTETAVPNPTATLPPPPTAPPPSTATPIPTPTATATPEPVTLLTLADFGDNRNPLTGELVPDPSVLQRRPIAVKLSNSPPEYTRPQAGLNQADLVFEHVTEGPITRFTAVFYSQDADPVGPIRSGRLIDLEIPLMYDAAFAYSGSAGPVRLMFRESDFFERIISPDFAHGGFYRIEAPDRAVEHTLFSDTPTLRYLLDLREQNTPPQFVNSMTFRDTPLFPGEPVSQLELDYGGTYVTWFYNVGNGRYTRWTDGEP